MQRRTNQIALGGRGDPDQHEEFEELLRICRDNMLVPNFTTSGYGMTPEIANICKRYCGAVAVSWYRSEYTRRAIQMLIDAGVRTNIHYVIGNNSIDEAINRLKNNDFPKGINAVIFLLHKPAGLGTKENMLLVDNPRVKVFFRELDKKDRLKLEWIAAMFQVPLITVKMYYHSLLIHVREEDTAVILERIW